RDVSVTTPGGTDTLAGGFTVGEMGEPTISGVNPTSGDQGETLSVTITGTSLRCVTAVDFGDGITVNSFTAGSDTQVTASITISSSAATGTRCVSVTTPGGTDTLCDVFM